MFAALRKVISETEVEHVEQELPSGLKELWRGDLERRGPSRERGGSAFWPLLDDRLEGRVPGAGAGDVACSVLARLRARVSAETAEHVRAELPPELREHWVAPEPGAEADEEPERFWGRVARDLDVGDDAARHAALSALGALRRVLPESAARRVEADLPEELRGFWQAG